MTLKLEHVTKRFGDVVAVNDLSLQVEKGTMYGFLGANGAGKTTTFRMILGLLEPTEGTITWNGEPIGYETSPYIGYLPEERGLYPKMKVLEQLIFLGQLRNLTKKEATEAALHWLERFEIVHYRDKKVEELSKGNQQKVQVIAALMHNPSLLILDEPFSGLDPVNVEMLKRAILDFRNDGATIIFSSHRMDHVEELCEQLSMMKNGTQRVHGSLREVKQSFGRKAVQLYGDFDHTWLDEIEGVLTYDRVTEGVKIQIEEERVAQQILHRATEMGEVRHFSIEEPSLHDIFIEKVGGPDA